jgi:hypothetical protein
VTFVPDGEGVNAPTYAQQHAPVAEQFEATGHAVRATYQYAAMAEVDGLQGRDDYSRALGAIYHDLVDRKMHLTGGLGAVHGIEGFGPAYELPNADAYLETCAAVGNVFFQMRMFLKTREARHVDVAEIALLNNCLAGIGLDGTSFFYPNPLEAEAGHAPRSRWFGTACCPSNIARLIPQVSGYLHAQDGAALFCLLYGQSTTIRQLGGTEVSIRQETRYPFDGAIELHVDPAEPTTFALHLRVPTWTGGQLVPGALYRYETPGGGWSLRVNGAEVEPELRQGFAVLRRTFRPGDRVRLDLPMPVQANRCDARVEANRGRVAFSRGPFVLCAEGIDNGGAVQRFVVDAQRVAAEASVGWIADGVLAGLPRIDVPALELVRPDECTEATLRLVPYFAWSNRDRSSMITWLPTERALARPDPSHPSNLQFAAVRASHTFEQDSVDALRQRKLPASSADRSIRRWTSWPECGKAQWVEIELDELAWIKSVAIYFYDDGGGVQLPQAWHVERWTDAGWQPVPLDLDRVPVQADAFNRVRPARAWQTDRLRLVLEPRHEETCVGILAVELERQP